ncbi:hypothetical protein BGZ76_006766 [Entomortierella beljakovae]|nr:hypothetical protein BGZ76_006766 [Entomortierella beljakovae]
MNQQIDIPNDQNVEAPIVESSTSQRMQRKSPFLGFKEGSNEELLLLENMVIHNPFTAAHGMKAEAWDRIAESLVLHDRNLAERGAQPVFDGVTSKTCKLKWDALFLKQKERVNKILNATGTVVNETRREELIERLYNDQVDAQKNKAAAKVANDRKRQKQEEGKAMGEALRAASVNKACFSSRDSDTGEESSTASTSNNSIARFYESKGKKKRRTLKELANVRQEILNRDDDRHRELQENHKESQEQNKEHHQELMQAINNQTEVFNRFATMFEQLVKNK